MLGMWLLYRLPKEGMMNQTKKVTAKDILNTLSGLGALGKQPLDGVKDTRSKKDKDYKGVPQHRPGRNRPSIFSPPFSEDKSILTTADRAIIGLGLREEEQPDGTKEVKPNPEESHTLPNPDFPSRM